MSDGIRGILEDMGKLSVTEARNRLGGHPGASESIPVPDGTGTSQAPEDESAGNHVPVPWCHTCGRIRHGAEPLHRGCE